MADMVSELMSAAGSGNNLSLISNAVGGNTNQVQSALGMGLPLIMGSMANTAAKPGGADMLAGMLRTAGASSPLDNMAGFLDNPAAAGGSAMVSTLFGSQIGAVQNAISQKTGLPPAIVGKVLEIAAPMVMGYVGKMFLKQNMDSAGLSSLLAGQSAAALGSSPDAAALAQQLMGGQAGAAGATGMMKKLFGR